MNKTLDLLVHSDLALVRIFEYRGHQSTLQEGVTHLSKAPGITQELLYTTIKTEETAAEYGTSKLWILVGPDRGKIGWQLKPGSGRYRAHSITQYDGYTVFFIKDIMFELVQNRKVMPHFGYKGLSFAKYLRQRHGKK